MSEVKGAVGCDLCGEEKPLSEGWLSKAHSNSKPVEMCPGCWDKVDVERCALCGDEVPTFDRPAGVDVEAPMFVIGEASNNSRSGSLCTDCRGEFGGRS